MKRARLRVQFRRKEGNMATLYEVLKKFKDVQPDLLMNTLA